MPFSVPTEPGVTGADAACEAALGGVHGTCGGSSRSGDRRGGEDASDIFIGRGWLGRRTKGKREVDDALEAGRLSVDGFVDGFVEGLEERDGEGERRGGNADVRRERDGRLEGVGACSF